MTTPTTTPLGLSPKAFTKTTGFSRSFTYDLMKRGELKSVKVGGRRVIPMSEAVRLTQGEGE